MSGQRVNGVSLTDATIPTAVYAGHATRTGLVTDSYVPISDTSADVVYQAIPMGSTATRRAVIVLADESYSGAYGSPLAHSITFKPPSGKQLDGVTNATAVILNGGGRWIGAEDASGNWHTWVFVA